METSISATNTLSTKHPRNSSIELLRIIAACMVVVLHYNGRALGVSTGLSQHILALLESVSVCAVDLFIIISGYFLCKTQKRTCGKPIFLLLILCIIVSTSYVVKSYVTGGGISWVTLIHSMIPPKNYFVLLYITLYIISPYINLVMNKLTDKSRTIFMIVALFLFSIYPTFIDIYQTLIVQNEVMGTSTVGAWGQQHGYNIVNFSLCYCIGAYIRLNCLKDKMKRRSNAFILAVSLLLLYTWFEIWLDRVPVTAKLIDCNALSYSNPLVLTIGAMLLVVFSRFHFENHIVNRLAKAAFVCYLFHLEIIGYLRIGDYALYGGWRLFLHLTVSVAAIYVISWCLWRLMEFVLAPIVKWLDRFPIVVIQENS